MKVICFRDDVLSYRWKAFVEKTTKKGGMPEQKRFKKKLLGKINLKGGLR